jgi:hypothetical protein
MMPAITQCPRVVEGAVDRFTDIFDNQCQRKHFGNYLTGLLVGRKKTVTGITNEIVHAKDQSCLNRFLTEVNWDEKQLNEERIQWLQETPDLRYHHRGSIAIDNVLIDHCGKNIADVAWLWDHAEDPYFSKHCKIAHDYLFANYVCPSGKHYPLEFRRFTQKEQCEQKGQKFVNHTKLFIELVDWTQERNRPGTFVFDSYFSSGEILNHINSLKDDRNEVRGYVCDLKSNRLVTFKKAEMSASEFAKTIPKEDRKQVIHRNGKKQWYFTVTVKVSKADHKCRIVFLWDKKGDGEPKKILLTNKTNWDITRIVDTYRDRWTGTGNARSLHPGSLPVSSRRSAFVGESNEVSMSRLR